MQRPPYHVSIYSILAVVPRMVFSAELADYGVATFPLTEEGFETDHGFA